MNDRCCSETDYIDFLLAAQRVFSCVEASKSQPEHLKDAAHDTYTRLLTRRPLDPEALWNEAQRVLGETVLHGGLLVLDDTTLDKPYARKMELVTRHWSGKHHRVVQGINLLSLVWTAGHRTTQDLTFSTVSPVVPVDFRVYDVHDLNQDGERLTKNDHFRAMVSAAKKRGLQPAYIAFDSWYAGLDNLKYLRQQGFHFLTRLKSNRQVNPDCSGLVAVNTLTVPAEGQVVQLRGFGLVRLFQKADAQVQQGQVEHWMSSDTTMSEKAFAQTAACWSIESYHRGIKQCCGIERAQVRSAIGQKNHLLLALRAFLRLEAHRLRTGMTWYAAKAEVVREAIRKARAKPLCRLTATA